MTGAEALAIIERQVDALAFVSDEVAEAMRVLRDTVGTDDVDFWPEATFSAALEVFGNAVYNRASRTYKNLDRRISWAMRSWAGKYGSLNPKQHAYADEVLAAAIRRALAAPDTGQRYAWAQAAIGQLVNHERVHEGMLSRAEVVAADLDADLLAGVA